MKTTTTTMMVLSMLMITFQIVAVHGWTEFGRESVRGDRGLNRKRANDQQNAFVEKNVARAQRVSSIGDLMYGRYENEKRIRRRKFYFYLLLTDFCCCCSIFRSLDDVIDARSMLEMSLSMSMSMGMPSVGPPSPIPPSGPPGPSPPSGSRPA